MASFGFKAHFSTRATTLRAAAVKRISAAPCRYRRRLVVTRAVKIEREDVFSRAVKVIKSQLDVEQVENDSTFTDLTSDSLDIVEVMMALEEEFDITFDDEESAKVTNVGEAVDLIKSTVESK